MESIAELKKIVQKSQVNYKSPWYARKVIRKISVYVTWLLLHTNVTANQVTIMQLIVSLTGIGLLCSADVWIAFVGVFLLHLGYVFDCVDGEIARYRKTQSINGLFLDFVNHEIIIPATFFGLGLHYYFLTGHNLVYLISSIIILVCLNNPVGKGRQTSIDYLIEKRKSPSYDLKSFKYDHGKNHPAAKPDDSSEQKRGLIPILSRLRTTIRKSYAYPYDMIIIFILIAFEANTGNSLVGRIFVGIFAVYLIMNQALELYMHVKNRIVERDFSNYIDSVTEIIREHSQS